MPSYPLTALVLRKTKLGETDLIVSLLAEDGRHVRAVAKGARKPGSRLTGRVEPYVTLDLLLHTGRTLEVVQEARIVEARSALRSDYDRTTAAAVVSDLLSVIAVEGQPEERLFALASATLDVMEDADSSTLPRFVVAFMVKAMAMHGYRPELASCAACGAPAPQSVVFSLAAGGVLCHRCAEADPACLEVRAEAISWLETLLRSTLAEIGTLEMPEAAVADCFDIMRAFVAYHIAARLKALDFYAGQLRPRS